jgi:hypothetical protein
MGLFWWASKDGIVKHEVEEQLKQKGPLMDWLKAHKALNGLILTMIAAGLAACPDPHCQQAFHILIVIGPTLVAAGITNSDVHIQAQQNFVKNGGVDQRK